MEIYARIIPQLLIVQALFLLLIGKMQETMPAATYFEIIALCRSSKILLKQFLQIKIHQTLKSLV